MILEGLKDLTDQLTTPVITVGTTHYNLQQVIEIFMQAYGLTPATPALPEPLQNYGHRHSIVHKDDIAVAFMKMIFYPEFDGYIGPRLWLQGNVPFTEELCLFDPSNAINTTLKLDAKLNFPYKTVNLQEIMSEPSYYKNDSTLLSVCLTNTRSGTQAAGSARKRHVGGRDACVSDTFKGLLTSSTLHGTSKPKLDDILKSFSKQIEPKISDLDLLQIEPNISDLDLLQIKQKVHAQYVYDAYINEID
jgi:hypothetical protein